MSIGSIQLSCFCASKSSINSRIVLGITKKKWSKLDDGKLLKVI